MASRAYPFFQEKQTGDEQTGVATAPPPGELARVMPLLQERLKTLRDTPDMASYFFTDDLDCDESLLVPKGMEREATANALEQVHASLTALPDFDAAAIEADLRRLATELSVSGRQLFGALRVATTGRTAAPPLFETMEVLGRERCLTRIAKAAERLLTA